MRYQIRHARVQFGGNVILRDVNFEVHDREKIAVVGRNGCGKTTLLKLIAGDIEMSNPDSDEECGITMAGGQEIGFLRQVNFGDAEVTVEDELKKVFVPVFACEERMKELEEQMKKMFFQGEISFNDEVYITNARHKQALLAAKKSLELTAESIEMGMPEDFFSIDLMNAYEELGSIIGEAVGEDLVNEIFSKFCTGK